MTTTTVFPSGTVTVAPASDDAAPYDETKLPRTAADPVTVRSPATSVSPELAVTLNLLVSMVRSPAEETTSLSALTVNAPATARSPPAEASPEDASTVNIDDPTCRSPAECVVPEAYTSPLT